jgi:hypothetical protein
MLSTHADRLERWLGPQVETLVQAGKGWHGPPIPVVGVPGNVFLRGGESGGDFVGPIDGGRVGNLYDFAIQRMKAANRRWLRNQTRSCNAGFASLGDLISEATNGKKRRFTYSKVGVTGVIGATSTLWYEGNQPSGGAVAAAAPGGTTCNDATVGSFPFTNPTGGDTQHLTRWDGFAGVAANTLMLYDRLFAVEKTMNSTATEAVTGVPTRYQSADTAPGNFLFIETRAALPATAHTWTVCTYTDQDGNPSTLPTVTGNSGGIAKRLDQPLSQWFCPLESGDTGIRELTQMQCSALVASGSIEFVIGHPLAVLAHPIINMMWTMDGVTGAFNLERVYDDACLAFLELLKPATTATTYTGIFETVSG